MVEIRTGSTILLTGQSCTFDTPVKHDAKLFLEKLDRSRVAQLADNVWLANRPSARLASLSATAGDQVDVPASPRSGSR